MTDILHHRTSFRPLPRISFAPVAQMASRIVIRFAGSLAGVPEAIARAFEMAYVDPFTPSRRRNDWSDPDNF